MFLALLAVLALAGAPASTPVLCHPGLLDGGAWGTTHFETQPFAVDLYGPRGCAAVLYASATAAERVQIARLNPSVNLAQMAGEGLLVALHEANHVALRTQQECLVEATAYAELPQLLAQVHLDTAAIATYAAAYDSFVRDSYHC